MTVLGLLCLWLSGVTPSPGWSTPVLVTDSCNTAGRPAVFLHVDNQNRFHLIWDGFNDEDSIAYKMFSLDGTELFPETLISRVGHHSVYLSTMVTGDSLYAFWRETSPVYYAVRSLTDGSEIVPATYLFTTYTLYPYIRASPDSLGRLHVIYNDGGDVRYAVWTPAPGSGFTVERDWKIEGADAGGVLLVDGNRVHVVVQDPVDHNYSYLQYDLNGNTVVPITDFTPDYIICNRFPELAVDENGNLIVVHLTSVDAYCYVLWKLDKYSGFTMINQKVIVTSEPPEMYVSLEFILRNIHGTDLFYLVWTDNGQDNQILFLLMNGTGDVVVDWAIAYDYSDEDPENLPCISGEADAEGNLYIAYEQGEIDPVMGYYPAFGWFDYDYVHTERQQVAAVPRDGFSFSCNPVAGSVTVRTGSETQTLRVYDITGREVSSIPVSDGTGIWHGRDFSGVRLPVGIYTVVGQSGFVHRLTLLGR